MNIFQKFFQLSEQDGQGYHIDNENQFWKFWPNGPFRVACHILLYQQYYLQVQQIYYGFIYKNATTIYRALLWAKKLFVSAENSNKNIFPMTPRTHLLVISSQWRRGAGGGSTTSPFSKI